MQEPVVIATQNLTNLSETNMLLYKPMDSSDPKDSNTLRHATFGYALLHGKTDYRPSK